LYGTRAWRAAALAVIASAGGRCEIAGPGCLGVATACDHIVPASVLAERGQLDRFFDPLLLRAACSHCNASTGASHGNSRRVPGAPRTAEARARAWAERYMADERRLARERLEVERRRPRPAIY
jgi:hypothetical protein